MIQSRFAVVLSSAVCLALLAPTSASAEEVRDDFYESFDVATGAELHLDHGDGDVIFTAWDRDVVDVKVHYSAHVTDWSLGGEKHKLEVRFRQDGDHIYVQEVKSGGVRVGIYAVTDRKYIYEISGPKYLRLDIEGEDGNVEISHWDSRLELLTDDGDVTLLDSNFEMATLELEDGDLEVIRCAAELDIQIDDGDIEFDRVVATTVRIESEDGDVDLDLSAEGAVDWQFRLEDGDLDCDFAGDVSADIYLESDDGRLELDVGGRIEKNRSGNRIEASIGDGDGRIRIVTDDGNIRMRHKSRAG